MRRRFAWALFLAALGLLTFVGFKTRAVARELVDPPFYRPQPLSRVEATFADLARGSDADPGGTWRCRDMGGLQVFTLTRHRPARGHVLLLHGFGDDRWGTSPALRWFRDLDATIFTFRRRDEALRAGRPAPPVTFGARESEDVVKVVHGLEAEGLPRARLLLMGRSMGASVGLLALARLEAEGQGPLGGILWEGAPLSTRDFAERLVRGPQDRFWHGALAPWIGAWAAALAGHWGQYDPDATVLLRHLEGRHLQTPSLAFIATQDRLAPAEGQRNLQACFRRAETVEVATWHLNASVVLGSDYDLRIRRAYASWLPEHAPSN